MDFSMFRLKLLPLTVCLSAGFGMLPAFAGSDSSPWHPFISLQGGLYDSSDSYLVAVEGGLGYETGPLIHYLFVGAGEVNRDAEAPDSPFGGIGGGTHSVPDLAEFEFGYRMAHRLNEKVSAFAEVGYETFSGSETGTDVLGNSVKYSYDSDHFFIGAGVRMAVWQGIHLDLSCRYLPDIADESFSTRGTDVLGNSVTILGDTPNFLVKLGVSYCF